MSRSLSQRLNRIKASLCSTWNLRRRPKRSNFAAARPKGSMMQQRRFYRGVDLHDRSNFASLRDCLHAAAEAEA